MFVTDRMDARKNRSAPTPSSKTKTNTISPSARASGRKNASAPARVELDPRRIARAEFSKFLGDCFDRKNVITQEDFEEDDDVVRVYPAMNNQNMKAHCVPRDSIIESIHRSPFNNIMVEWIPVVQEDNTGLGSTRSRTRQMKPTVVNYVPGGRLFMKLPVNNMYVSIRSFKLFIHRKNAHVKDWMIVPLLQETTLTPMRVRLGNTKGIVGRSMNHGQSEEPVYKLVKRKDWEAKKRPETRVRMGLPHQNEFGNLKKNLDVLLHKDAKQQLEELEREVLQEIEREEVEDSTRTRA